MMLVGKVLYSWKIRLWKWGEKFLIMWSEVILGDHNDIAALLITLMTIKRRIWVTQKLYPNTCMDKI